MLRAAAGAGCRGGVLRREGGGRDRCAGEISLLRVTPGFVVR
jgi:hypothetical protein